MYRQFKSNMLWLQSLAKFTEYSKVVFSSECTCPKRRANYRVRYPRVKLAEKFWYENLFLGYRIELVLVIPPNGREGLASRCGPEG